MPLIPDTDKAVATLYGAREFFGRLPARATYVIDTAGTIRAVSTHRLQIERHSSDALAVVQELAAAAEAEEQLP